MRKLTLIFLISIIFLSCKTQVIGDYKYYDGYVTHHLSIESDSTFLYKTGWDLSKSETKGIWRTDKNNLVLNSFDEYVPYVVQEISDKNEESRTIKITDDQGLIIKGNFITLDTDKSKKYFINDYGIITLPIELEFMSFTIYSLNGEFVYNIKSKDSNTFLISYNSSEIKKYFLKNYRLEIKKNKLISSDPVLVLRKK